MISLNQAVKRGIATLRLPIWANRKDHIKIDIFKDGTHGPWVHLICPGASAYGCAEKTDVLFDQFNWDERVYIEHVVQENV